MARYLNEQQALEDGYRIVHEPDKQQFSIVRNDKVFGEAAYVLNDDGSQSSIDFNRTVVDDELKGTGMAGLLAEHALNDHIVKGRKVEASCSFIAGYLKRNPHLGGVR